MKSTVLWLAAGLALLMGACHQASPLADAGAGDGRPADSRGGDAAALVALCQGCHGGAANLAPPLSLAGKSGTAERGVGAHQQHLAVSSWHAPVQCEACHLLPRAVTDPGHIDTALPAELVFSTLASTDGARPSWDGSRCSGTYCHGATLSAGTDTRPIWTRVDGSQVRCGGCHGLPPGPPHVASDNCSSCHSSVDAGRKIIAPAQHINGKVEANGQSGHPGGWGGGAVHGPAFLSDPRSCKACHGPTLTGGSGGQSCESCHSGWKTNCTFCHGGSNKTGAPPEAVDGKTAFTFPGVGRHTSHVTAGATHVAYACTICHKTPADALSPGHIDPSPAEVVFSGLPGPGSYDAKTHTCSNVYCHGNGKQGTGGSALWTGSLSGGCSACHDDQSDGQAMTLGGRHMKHIVDKKLACADCHGCVVSPGNQITDQGKHLDGARDVCGAGWNSAARSCTPSCHVTKTW